MSLPSMKPPPCPPMPPPKRIINENVFFGGTISCAKIQAGNITCATIGSFGTGLIDDSIDLYEKPKEIKRNHQCRNCGASDFDTNKYNEKKCNYCGSYL